MDPLDFVRDSSLWFKKPGSDSEQVAARGRIIPIELGGGALYRRGRTRPSRSAPLTRPHQSDGSEFFLKYEGGEARRGSIDAPILWKASRGPVAESFKRRSGGAVGPNLVLIEYWYHSAFSFADLWGLGDHQGDWEGMTALIELRLASDGSLKHELKAAYFAAHEGGSWICASRLSWAHEALDSGGLLAGRAPASQSRHPEAFSSLGTHATYSAPGKHEGPVLTDVAARGTNWDTWKYLRPLELEPYYGYSGAWGEATSLSFMTGPLAPGPTFKPMPRPLPEAFGKTCSL